LGCRFIGKSVERFPEVLIGVADIFEGSAKEKNWVVFIKE